MTLRRNTQKTGHGLVLSLWPRTVEKYDRLPTGNEALKLGCPYLLEVLTRMLALRRSSRTGLNSLAPGEFDYSLKLVNLKLISMINILSIFCEIAIRWMPQHLTDHYKSKLVQVMAWCHQATSHYLSQCLPRSLSPYDVTRQQWVNSLASGRWGCNFKFILFKLPVRDRYLQDFLWIALT